MHGTEVGFAKRRESEMTEKTITITWRDENYGRISGSVAFRVYDIEPFPSMTGQKKLQTVYKNAGFEFNNSRQSWIAEENPAKAGPDLAAALEELGYEVKHSGCVPDELENSASAPTVPVASPKI
jgi:hypothetical protein